MKCASEKKTSATSAAVVQAFQLGQAIGLGMAAQIGLDVMIAEFAKACQGSGAIYLRYELSHRDAQTVASHGTFESDQDNQIPSAAAVVRLRAGHVQAFGPRGDRRSMIVLGRNDCVMDVLVLSHDATALLSAVSDLLANAWLQRRNGLIQTALNTDLSDEVIAPILSAENSFGLTRKEVQICHLLMKGLKPHDIIERLGCAMPTVRTHLRNIYAKTGTDGMVSVVHQLHAEKRVPNGCAA